MNNEIVLKYNKGTEYLNKGKAERGERLLREVVKTFPCKEAYTNLGNCYRILGRDKEMITCYEKALDPKVPFLDKSSETDLHALNNLGLSKFMYGDDVGALKLYGEAITKKPDFWEAIWNASTAELRRASNGEVERFPIAWEMYRSRFLKKPAIQLKNTRNGLRYWDKFSRGTAIVVLAEQGIGDNIMFGRFLPLLHKWFEKVYVQCEPSLASMFRYAGINTVWDPSEVPENDLVAFPICSLGEVFNVWEHDPEWLKGFGRDENIVSEKPRMGIVWSGSSTHANNAYRSVPVGFFSRFSKDYELYSFNPGVQCPSWVKKLPIKNWEDTATFARSMDTFVSVDTSIVHLLGSMGLKCHMVQPYKETDFRWGHGNTVWYKSIKIHQNNQDWEQCFQGVQDALR